MGFKENLAKAYWWCRDVERGWVADKVCGRCYAGAGGVQEVHHVSAPPHPGIRLHGPASKVQKNIKVVGIRGTWSRRCSDQAEHGNCSQRQVCLTPRVPAPQPVPHAQLAESLA